MDETEQLKSFYRQAVTNPAALSIRLETDRLLLDFENQIKGIRELITSDSGGNEILKVEQVGGVLANTEGIQNIMRIMKLIINPHTAQANFYRDGKGFSGKYEDFMYYTRIDIGFELVLNRYNWGIKSKNLKGIYDSMLRIIELFLTRPIGNQERILLGESFKSAESQIIQNKGGFSLWKNKNG